MAIKIKDQRCYFVTESSIEVPVDTTSVDEEMLECRADGKMIVQYNGGKCPGVHLEQKTKIPDHIAPRIRALLGIKEKII
jgi:hypothetical protein